MLLNYISVICYYVVGHYPLLCVCAKYKQWDYIEDKTVPVAYNTLQHVRRQLSRQWFSGYLEHPQGQAMARSSNITANLSNVPKQKCEQSVQSHLFPYSQTVFCLILIKKSQYLPLLRNPFKWIYMYTWIWSCTNICSSPDIAKNNPAISVALKS